MKTSRRPRRKPAPRFELTDVERMLLMLYRAVGVETRAQVGTLLFEAWTHTPKSDQQETQKRYEAAEKAFQTGPLMISLFDDLCAGRGAK